MDERNRPNAAESSISMWEWLTLSGFVACLLICVAAGQNILWALTAGFVLFMLYGLKKGFGLGQLFKAAGQGVSAIKGILLVLTMVGMLTAVWRAGGTLAIIIYYSTHLITPGAFVLLTFLLCSLISFLTGTSFGTSATMGVICTAVGCAMGVDRVLMGGAVLSGAFVGDRCSPMSTSALLVAELTKTDIYANIRRMMRTGLGPLLATALLYGVLGMKGTQGTTNTEQVRQLFSSNFVLGWVVVLPAALILVLSLCRVKVKYAMAASIVTGSALCLWVQGISPSRLAHIWVFGFSASDPALAPLLNGGGILSMLRVVCIVCLSSSFSGIFQLTGLLDGVRRGVDKLCSLLNPYAGVVGTALLTSCISCNQSLAILLTHQLCKDAVKDPDKLALYMENSAAVIPALIPWSIAGTVCLDSVGAPMVSLAAAFYLYLIVLYNLAISFCCPNDPSGRLK